MVKVIGIGNPLLGDDGFGLQVIEHLKDFKKKDVTFIALPTPSPWDLYEVFLDGDFFIVIDALAEGKDGEIEIFPISDLVSFPTALKTLHEVSIAQVLEILKFNDRNVNGVVVGTKAFELSPSLYLSEKINALIPQTVNIVKNLLAAHLS